ncbi:MFS transporter [Streptomyces sp. NPDC050355]|uniref:MFS transporter n=1 Tax=Streptomyces sp. NPDC050355 TaxID=3365609 RepID=UPI0037919B2B
MTTSPPTTAQGAPTDARRFPVWLVCLCVASFTAGTDNFVIAGVLKDIAQGLHVSEAVAGQLITVFSLTYALSAPFVALRTARYPRRRVLMTALALFAAANVGAALAPTYGVLVVFRILTALAGASIMPAAFSTAAALAPKGAVGRYLGSVTFGQSVALVVGVPVGTAIAGAFGWRATMIFVGALALVVIAGVAVFLPALPGVPAIPLRRRLAPLGHRPVLLGLVGTVVGATGNFMTFSYIAVIADDLGRSGPGQLAFLVSLMGIASACGALIGGRAADSWGAGRTIVLALSLQVSSTLLLAVFGWAWPGSVSVVAVALLLAGWGIFGGALNPPLQTRLLSLAGDAGNEVVALNSSCLFLGISLSGGLGGLVLAGLGPVAVLAAAGAVGAVSVLILSWSIYGDKAARSQNA